MVDIGSKTSRSIVDYKLSRYACYLIVQNSYPRKKVIAKNGGIMPENLPTPDKSLKQIEKEIRNKLISNK